MLFFCFFGMMMEDYTSMMRKQRLQERFSQPYTYILKSENANFLWVQNEQKFL